MTTIKSVQKVSRSGNALIVNIPVKVIEILGVQLGDYLNIDWGEVIKVPKKTKKIQKKKEIKENTEEKEEEKEEEELPELE